MNIALVLLIVAGALVSACASSPSARPDLATLTKQVTDVERGFAKTMADRDYVAFQRFLADDAIFFAQANAPLRGRNAVAVFWKKFYDRPDAPFSWEPELVQVLDSGVLALSSGPVRDSSGKHFANFQSIWRLESLGVWKIVFDKGERVCDCAK
jgi:ketosteroid isomerase-like protein